ncbi:MAG TPA: TonB-dependent receptor [bacterium]|jgi:outer membrane cobalamin receptor
MRLRVVPAVCAIAGMLCALTWTPPVRGQEPPEFEGEEIVVPGRRSQSTATTPAYVTVIPGSLLRALGFLTLADALQFFAEINVRSAGSGPGGLQQVSIRGSSPQQVLILIDGVPLNGTSQFGINLSTITLADVDRVEILRGPYSAIYGSGALGGVINIVTRGDPQSEGSLAGTTTPGAQFAVRIGRKFPGGTISLGAERLWTQGDRPNSDALRWTAGGRIVFQRSPTAQLTLLLHHTSGEGGAPGSTVFPSLTDRVSDGRTVGSVTWTVKQPEGGERQARLWGLADRVTFLSPSAGYRAFSNGTAVGMSWQQVRQIPNGLLTWGLEGQQVSFAYRDASPFGSTRFSSSEVTVAGYVQYDVIIREKTLLGAGLRYDVDSLYGSQLNPRVGFVHFLTPALRLRGGIGRTFRGPTFGELFFPGCSNPGLKPESAWSADLGLEATVRPSLQVRVNGFATQARNLIVGGCNPRNVGLAAVSGLSGELVGRLADRWAVSVNATWTHASNLLTGRAILRVPAAQANMILRYTIDAKRSLALLANYVSDRTDLDFSVFPAKVVSLTPYLAIGARYERRLADWVIRVGVDNVFDVRYAPLRGFPAPRRTFYVQFGRAF